MHFYCDYHIHSNFSLDSNSSMEAMIENALQKGLYEITFTDHIDFDYPNYFFEFNLDDYLNQIEYYKSKYKNKISLKTGIEIGLQPHLSDKNNALINKYPFDFVIASTHIIDKLDPYCGTFFTNKTQTSSYQDYFKEVLYNVKNFNNYNVCGHLDYIVRYGNFSLKYISYYDISDICDEIFKHIIKNGNGIEINSSAYRYGFYNPHPKYDFIKRYKELGGEIITIGSDAHKPEHICSNFSQVYDILNSLNIKYITIFEQRQPKFIKI